MKLDGAKDDYRIGTSNLYYGMGGLQQKITPTPSAPDSLFTEYYIGRGSLANEWTHTFSIVQIRRDGTHELDTDPRAFLMVGIRLAYRPL